MDEQLQIRLQHAQETGAYLVAVWWLEGERLEMFRQTRNFPRADFQKALSLLGEDLAKEETEAASPPRNGHS